MQKNRGFTLIELIVVLVIIGITVSIALPRYTSSFNSIHFRKKMSELVSFLREARIEAISTGTTTQVTLDLYKGICWNDNGKIQRIPPEIEIFTDKIEARDEQIKVFEFYSNGTAQEAKLGFIYDKMIAILYIEPLGGLAYFRINEEMDQTVRYTRSSDVLSDEEIKKIITIDKKEDFDKLTKDLSTDFEDSDSYLDEDNGLDEDYRLRRNL